MAMGRLHRVAWVCGCLLSSILLVRLWGGSMERASFVVKRGVCGEVCCSGMEEDSTPSEEWWIYFGLKLANWESV